MWVKGFGRKGWWEGESEDEVGSTLRERYEWVWKYG